MSGTFLPVAVFRAVDANGAPIAGALLQFYLTGTNTPATVYTTSSLATALSNPVAADSGGLFAPIYLDPTVTYRMQLQTALGGVIRDIDPVATPLAIPSNAISAAMLQAGVAISNLGFTPVSKAGDTATNLLLANTTLAANSAGYIGAPANEQDGNYTFALSDAGKMVRANIVSAAAWTIPPGSSVAYPAGTVMLLRNAYGSTASVTVTRSGGVTLTGAGGSTNKDWALAPGGMASLTLEATPNVWVIGGVGLS